MRIKEFAINRYGPLIETGNIPMGDFNLLFGNNEKGKTLTIDALIKLLIGKGAKDFKHVDRVEGNPSGYLTISFNGSRGEKTLPEDGDLPKITSSMSTVLTPSDCRNIFIIRNSELSILNEAFFYTGITERLVGLRTSDIKKIRKNLLEIGNLTDGLDFKNDEKSVKLKDRLKKADFLLERTKSLKEDLLNEEFDRLEIEAYKRSEELSRIDTLIDEYEDARNRGKYERCSVLLSELEKTISELKNMEIFRDEDFQIWQDSEREVQRGEKEISELRDGIDSVKRDISLWRIKVNDINHNINTMDGRRRILDNNRIGLSRIKDDYIRIQSDISLKSLLKRISLLSTAISIVLLLIALYAKYSIYIYLSGAIALMITIFLWSLELILVKREGRVKRKFEELKLSLAELGLNADTIMDMMSNVQRFSDEFESMKKKHGEYESILMSMERELSGLNNKITVQNGILEEKEKEIASIKTRSGVQTLDEYRNALGIKRERERYRDSISSKLEGLLEVHGKSLGENINLLKSKIQELEGYRDKGKGIAFTQNRYIELKERRNQLKTELNGLMRKLESTGMEMDKIEREANEIIISDNDRLYCKTLIDLEEIMRRLKFFIENNNQRRINTRDTISILDEIEKEERKKVLELFDRDAHMPVSQIFNIITDGLYTDVIYDREEERIKVKQGNGETIDALSLSGGAYDQLYLAIRLALGEKLLNSEKGFFIMDDPLIKSDIRRIERQLETLKKIAVSGWQIIYFSAKKEIKEALLTDIEKEKINYVEINWVN